MINHILEDGCEKITNNYSTSHQAIDVISACGGVDDVIAVSDGTVEMVVRNVKYTNHNARGSGTYGNYVKIKHSDGKKSLYAHLAYESVTVAKGQAVSKGQKIGTMGETGNAYGKHLHFEIRNSDEARENPNDYLNKSIEPAKVITKAEKKEESSEDSLETTKEEETNTQETATASEEENVSSEEINVNSSNSTESNTSEDIDENILDLNHTSSAEKKTAKKTSICDDYEILENINYYGGSIVDGLKGIGVDSSYDYRNKIALKNGIEDYHGTYDQNVYLLQLLKQGKLKS